MQKLGIENNADLILFGVNHGLNDDGRRLCLEPMAMVVDGRRAESVAPHVAELDSAIALLPCRCRCDRCGCSVADASGRVSAENKKDIAWMSFFTESLASPRGFEPGYRRERAMSQASRR